MLKIGTRKTKYGYRGYLACYNRKQKLWKYTSGIDRLNRIDALEDANKLLEHYKQTHIWEE